MMALGIATHTRCTGRGEPAGPGTLGHSYMVTALYSHGLYSYGLYRYGLYSYEMAHRKTHKRMIVHTHEHAPVLRGDCMIGKGALVHIVYIQPK